MRKIVIVLFIISLFLACNKNKNKQMEDNPEVRKVIAKEILQVREYTYLKASENENEIWLATPSIKLEKGKTYYFKNGMEMTNFESKELNRTFKKILFVDVLSSDANLNKITTTPNIVTNNISHQAAKPKIEKEEIIFKPEKGIVSIAEVYKNFKSFEGKTLKIKGKVTKYNPAILKRNWIHIQDGTEFNSNFDLTATITEEVKLGDIITIEGIVIANKDFGFGYTYDFIMENAKIIK